MEFTITVEDMAILSDKMEKVKEAFADLVETIGPRGIRRAIESCNFPKLTPIEGDTICGTHQVFDEMPQPNVSPSHVPKTGVDGVEAQRYVIGDVGTDLVLEDMRS